MKPNPERIAKGHYWDRAWSLVEGCSPVSAGCEHCWAAQATHMRAQQKNPKIRARYRGLTNEDGTWNGKIRLMKRMGLPLRIKNPTVWSIWNDLFHPDVPTSFIWAAYEIMAACPRHTFIVCTKRPERIVSVLYEEGYGYLGGGDYLPNVWHLTTTENQEQADIRIPELLKLRDASPGWPVLGVSVEPMLSPIDFSFLPENGAELDWTICGAETGLGARPMELSWARALRDQCAMAGVSFFMKKVTGRKCPPEDLMIREFPLWI